MLNPARLVFIDETASSTSMVRLRGRCPRGERLIGSVPHGHRKTITLVAGLRHDRIVAPFVIADAMNGSTFLTYVERCLAPTLHRGDIVIIDNLPAHKVAGVTDAIEAAGARAVYLPPYSPDLNPIEQLFRWGNRPAFLWIAEDLGCCGFRLMVKRGPRMRPQASEGEAGGRNDGRETLTNRFPEIQ